MNHRTAQTLRSVNYTPANRAARVLLVDRLAITGPMLRRWLEQRGHMLDVANDPENGFDRAVTASPDVVLIDLGRDPGSGFALANRLSTDPATRAVPLVAMCEATTALPDRANTVFARNVLKPIDVDELGAILLEAAAQNAELYVGR
jgi:CheY-like chemotaxis protein